MNQADSNRAGDRAARATAATVFDRPITVQAGAGTGKTTLLTHRLLVWVLDAGWSKVAHESTDTLERVASRVLERVRAVTFTEAAAAELAERFVESVAAAGRLDFPAGFDRGWLQVDDATLRERVRWLLPQVDRAQISTIHSWCYDLLRRHPYDAGLDPDLTIIADAQEIEAIARDVVEDHYRLAYEQGPQSDLFRLGEDKIDPRDWVEMARTWVVAGWDPQSSLPSDDGVEAYLTAVKTACAYLADSAPPALAELGGNQLAGKVLIAAGATTDLELDDAHIALERLRETWPNNLAGRVRKWSEDDYTKAESEAAADARGTVTAAANDLSPLLHILPRVDPERWRMRQRVLRAVVDGVENRLREDGLITFGGLLRDAVTLLDTNPAIAARERSRLDQLLVDEFQDTDARQATLIDHFALSEVGGPSLIVVGDPKQSIYGWRSADLETYERVRGAILDRGGEEVILHRNFRSTTSILAAVDRIAGGQMKPDPGFQPEYHGLEPGAPHATTDPVPVEVYRYGKERSATAARMESEWLAHDLAERQARGELEWSQAAVLIRAKTHARPLLRALRAAGVPYVMSADTGFHERSEVIDAVAWVRVIVDPTDQLALLKVCRSPTVGIPDAALAAGWKDLEAQVRELGRSSDHANDCTRELLAGAASRLKDVPGLDRIDGWVDYAAERLGHIGMLRRALRELPFADFLETLREATDIEAIEAARPEGGARVANLTKLFDQLAHQVEESGGDTHAVLRVLRRGIVFELPAEEAVSLTPADGAVQVATIHAVKGLEFDHVYLAHLGTGGGQDNYDLQVEATVPAATVIQRVAHPRWAYGKVRRDRVDEAERLRLLYVALTRARKRLAICLQTGASKGTIAHLLDQGLDEAGAEIVERILEPPAIEVGQPKGNVDAPELANPEWTVMQDPAPFHDSWTRQSHAANMARSEPGFRGSGRGSLVHKLLAEVRSESGEFTLPGWAEGNPTVEEFWTGFVGSVCADRLLALADRLRGREVDILTPGSLLESDAAYATGAIDLLYQDPDGTWVIADYKTGNPDDLADAVSFYAPQLRYYGRATTEALALETPPRLELWFLDLDQIEVVSSE